MNARLVMALAVLAAVLASSSSSAQINNSDCQAARTWHLQQAMKLDEVSLQEYHLAAADAAGQLATMTGGSCSGWQQWAAGSAVTWSAPS